MGLLALISLVVAAGEGSASVTVEDELRRAKNEYAYGNYEQAVESLRGLLYPMRLYSDDDVIEGRRYLGLSLYLLDRQEEAKEEFTKLLYLAPDYELDPFTVAPPLIEFFESIRKAHKDVLDGIRTRRKEGDTEPRHNLRRTVMVTQFERSEIATYLPFGIGQFQNGDIWLGVVFAVLEAALLATNISSYLWLRSQDDNGRPAYPAARASEVQAVTILQFAAIGTFGVVWSMGVLHARLNFVPVVEDRKVTDEILNPSSGNGAKVLLTVQF